MRIEGAIEDFSVDPHTLEPMILTVGNVRPRGICGSGLINIVARLFEAGIIDNLGKFNRDLKSDRLREKDGVYEYILARSEKTQIGRDIVITENDIGNLIRAKGAIYSGCQTLLDEVGLKIADLDRIILAGGFGSHIDIEMAMTIGLLPEIDPDKITYIGNGSLLGARMCCADQPDQKRRCQRTEKDDELRTLRNAVLHGPLHRRSVPASYGPRSFPETQREAGTEIRSQNQLQFRNWRIKFNIPNS